MNRMTKKQIVICFLAITLAMTAIHLVEIFFLTAKIAHGYEVHQNILLDRCDLYGQDRGCIVKGVLDWIVKRGYIYGFCDEKAARWFIYNTKTKKLWLFNVEVDFNNKLKELHLSFTMSDTRWIYDYSNGIYRHLHLDEQEAFRKLSAHTKIQKILEEYRYDNGDFPRLFLYDYANILTEDLETNIPILFTYLNQFDMYPVTEADQGYNIIEWILFDYFYVNDDLLNQDDLNTFCTITQRKIDAYLKKYKTIDKRIILAEKHINSIKKGRFNTLQSTPQMLYEKYTALWYNDLIVEQDSD